MGRTQVNRVVVMEEGRGEDSQKAVEGKVETEEAEGADEVVLEPGVAAGKSRRFRAIMGHWLDGLNGSRKRRRLCQLRRSIRLRTREVMNMKVSRNYRSVT